MKTKGKLGWLLVLLPLLPLLLLADGAMAAASPGEKGASGPAPVSQVSDEERGDKLKQLEAAAEALYGHMQQGHAQEAHAEMERLIAALEGVSFKGLTSVEGIHALAESIMNVRETLARAEIVPEEWTRSSAVLRLAVNSLLHKDKGLWLQYYKVMADDMQQMSNARVGGQSEKLRAAFQNLQQHYETIRPAAAIRRDPSAVNRFDSWMSYAERLSSDKPVDEAALKQAIRQGESALKALFGRKGEEPVFLPIAGYENPWYWSGLIGLWIVLALGYTGLRKYRAAQAITGVGGTDEDSYRYRL
ncbi:sporulation protein YpjB [Paenibacillus oralis]|uniref:sporulation protein YpjB n=1 Tax=Paenibacillus oralis TaxID=2490856 RepID=UPI001FE3D35C|nr:sporulation protein YpjB [Paenibacillus oralis]